MTMENVTEDQITKPQRVIPVVAIIAAIIGLTALGLAAFLVWRTQLAAQQLQTVKRGQTSQSQNTSHLQTQFDQIQQQQQLQQQAIDKTQTGLARVLETRGLSQQRWSIGEADHLLRLAQMSMQYQRNVAQAILLLKAADQRLSMITDPKYVVVRQAIADKLAALRGVEKIDPEGMLNEFSALSKQLSQLPLAIKMPEKDQQAADKTEPNKAAKNKWRKALDNSMQELSKIIVLLVLPLRS